MEYRKVTERKKKEPEEKENFKKVEIKMRNTTVGDTSPLKISKNRSFGEGSGFPLSLKDRRQARYTSVKPACEGTWCRVYMGLFYKWNPANIGCTGFNRCEMLNSSTQWPHTKGKETTIYLLPF